MIIPKFSLQQFLAVLQISVFGALVAGLFGIIHDQLTYTLSPAYFTKFKFEQFKVVDFGFHNRIFVAFIGFMASWWVGLIIGWILGRMCIKENLKSEKKRAVIYLFGVLGGTLLANFLAWGLAVFTQNPENLAFWQSMIHDLSQEEVASFRTVGFIHNGAYIGGCLITIVFIIFLNIKNTKKNEKELDSQSLPKQTAITP
jgi:hypothetical protein